jgi:hypothetical protein
MDTSTDYGRLSDGRVGALAALTDGELVTLGVGAVMALQSVDRWTATTALNCAADRFQIPVSAVAHAVLTLATGSDETVGDRAGSAAAHLLVDGFPQVP